MAPSEAKRRLIVNADDFGRSSSINQAVIQAHQAGILTTASLMVNGHAAAEAVEFARKNPRLGVGLHLTLVCGRSALKPTEAPGLVDAHYQFRHAAVATGFRYYFIPSLRAQVRREIHAQVQKFQQSGLRLDHLDGHLNLHLHPTVFSILKHHAREWGIDRFRLTRDPFWLNARLASGQWGSRIAHALIFSILSRRARPALDRLGIRHTQSVFGLLANGRVDERYVARLMTRLPPGDSELYSHPSLDEFKHELNALVSPRVKSLVEQNGIELIRYQDL